MFRELSREQQSWFVSGFAAGEGYFGLQIQKTRTGRHVRGVFAIGLRADDCEILKQLLNFFGCGRIGVYADRKPKMRIDSLGCVRVVDNKPFVRYGVYDSQELERLVIPHFDRYPMVSCKKQRDYVLWREGVLILATANRRPRKGRKPRGQLPQLYPHEFSRIEVLVEAISRERAFGAEKCGVLPAKSPQDLLSLMEG